MIYSNNNGTIEVKIDDSVADNISITIKEVGDTVKVEIDSIHIDVSVDSIQSEDDDTFPMKDMPIEDMHNKLMIHIAEDKLSGTDRLHKKWSELEENYVIWLRASGYTLEEIGADIGRSDIAVRDKLLEINGTISISSCIGEIRSRYEMALEHLNSVKLET